MKSYACAFGASVVVAASAFAGDPVEWPIASGGNGHWYGIGPAQTWTSARDFAVAQGGHLVTLQTQSEWDFAKAQLSATGHPYWLGMFQDPPTGLPPALGWRWVTDEPFRFTAWDVGEPNDWLGYQQWVGQTSATGEWDDTTPDAMLPSVIEWSADCNGDGVVDFGQIRAGQLADANADNIPDVCQCPTPHVVRVPQDAPSIDDAVALACPGSSLEIVLSPGIWPMAIDTGNPGLSITIRGLDQATCLVTAASPGTLLNARYGSPVRLMNLTVADLAPSKAPAQDLAWDLSFDGCVVRNCTGSFLFDGGASPFPAALGTRFESCTGSVFGILYLSGSETINLCDFVNCTRGLSVWGTSTITNCTFTGTSGYAVQARASFQMSGCDFTNTAGPAISCDAAAPIAATIANCGFLAGSTWAIRDLTHDPANTVLSHTWSITGCAFEGNVGSLQFGRNRIVALDSCQFTSNREANIEQGLSFVGSFVASNCAFTDNEAGVGGAYACSSVNEARFISCTFTNNRAVYGGAIWAEYSRCFVTDCVFTQNSASSNFWESGGAIEVVLGTAVISGCEFVQNSAPSGSGGAIACNNANTLYFDDLPLKIEDCDFRGNSAGYYGGAIYFHGANLAGIAVADCRFDGNGALGGTAVMAIDVNFDITVSGCAVANEGPASTFRVTYGTNSTGGIVVGTSSICAGSPTPFAGATDDGTNCIAASCDDLDGNGRPDECDLYLDVPAQFPTIQAAIDAVPGNARRIVRVAAGTYNESFALNGKDVVVRGVPGGGTILDGTGLTSAIARFAGEPATAGVQDLVFRNGTVGSRIFPEATYEVGGAIYANQSGAFIRRCEFRQNRSDFGGAAYLYKCSTLIEDSLFTGNTADEEGGAVMAFESTVTARGTAFVSNQCGAVNPGSGSGFKSVGARVAGETSLLENCSFTGGTAGVDGAAVEHFENTVSVPGSIRIVNTQITGNSTGVRAGGLRVIGRMQSCVIVAGTTICGNANRNVDGPFFIEGSVSICDCLADVAVDGSVNGGDLGLMLNAWGITNSQGTGDVNHNGVVNGEDLSILLSAWGGCS